MQNPLLLWLVKIARSLTGKWIYQKKLPKAFGPGRVFVSPRSDIRLLAPGLRQSASDLFLVAERYIKRGDVVWDIGSNLGLFAFCSAWKSGPTGAVHTLEADPFYAELQHRTARGLPQGYAPVIPLCAAAADRPRLLELSIPKKGQSRNHLSILEGNAAEETESKKQVVCLTADFLIEQWPAPHFVKVDIEGAEILFLDGAKRLLSGIRPCFYIEVNAPNQDRATGIFHEAGYDLFVLSPEGTEIPVDRCAFNTLARPR